MISRRRIAALGRVQVPRTQPLNPQPQVFEELTVSSMTPAVLSLSELVTRRTVHLSEQDSQRIERAEKLEVLAFLDTFTAYQAIHAIPAPNDRDLESIRRGVKKAAERLPMQEIPPHSAAPELPAGFIDGLMNYIGDVRDALQTIYGDEPPRPGPGRLPKPTPESEARWYLVQTWLFDTSLTEIRVEATALAQSAAGRDELRTLVSDTLRSLIWRLAQGLRCDIPLVVPESPNAEQWADQQKKDAAFIESLRQQTKPSPDTESSDTTGTDALPNTDDPAQAIETNYILRRNRERAEDRQRDAADRQAIETNWRGPMRELRPRWDTSWEDLWNALAPVWQPWLTPGTPDGEPNVEAVVTALQRVAVTLRQYDQIAAHNLTPGYVDPHIPQTLAGRLEWVETYEDSFLNKAPVVATALVQLALTAKPGQIALTLRTILDEPDDKPAFGWLLFIRDCLWSTEVFMEPANIAESLAWPAARRVHIDDTQRLKVLLRPSGRQPLDNLTRLFRGSRSPFYSAPTDGQALLHWEDNSPPATETPESPPENKVKGKAKGKNIEARMLKLMADDLDSHDWDSEQWAQRLNCKSGTVRGTKTWKQRLPAVRAGRLLDRAEVKKLTRRESNDPT